MKLPVQYQFNSISFWYDDDFVGFIQVIDFDLYSSMHLSREKL
jgi:hypothetical protein